MTLQIDAKFDEKLTLDSKNDIRNLVNFNASNGKSENVHFDVLLCQLLIKFQLKITEELSLMTLKSDANFEEKLTFLFEK